MLARAIGYLIFWVAGTIVAYFVARDPEKSVETNIRELAFVLPVLGAIIGVGIFILAYLTTGPDYPEDYREYY